jgi:hypothetical protein
MDSFIMDLRSSAGGRGVEDSATVSWWLTIRGVEDFRHGHPT